MLFDPADFGPVDFGPAPKGSKLDRARRRLSEAYREFIEVSKRRDARVVYPDLKIDLRLADPNPPKIVPHEDKDRFEAERIVEAYAALKFAPGFPLNFLDEIFSYTNYRASVSKREGELLALGYLLPWLNMNIAYIKDFESGEYSDTIKNMVHRMVEERGLISIAYKAYGHRTDVRKTRPADNIFVVTPDNPEGTTTPLHTATMRRKSETSIRLLKAPPAPPVEVQPVVEKVPAEIAADRGQSVLAIAGAWLVLRPLGVRPDTPMKQVEEIYLADYASLKADLRAAGRNIEARKPVEKTIAERAAAYAILERLYARPANERRVLVKDAALCLGQAIKNTAHQQGKKATERKAARSTVQRAVRQLVIQPQVTIDEAEIAALIEACRALAVKPNSDPLLVASNLAFLKKTFADAAACETFDQKFALIQKHRGDAVAVRAGERVVEEIDLVAKSRENLVTEQRKPEIVVTAPVEDLLPPSVAAFGLQKFVPLEAVPTIIDVVPVLVAERVAPTVNAEPAGFSFQNHEIVQRNPVPIREGVFSLPKPAVKVDPTTLPWRARLRLAAAELGERVSWKNVKQAFGAASDPILYGYDSAAERVKANTTYRPKYNLRRLAYAGAFVAVTMVVGGTAAYFAAQSTAEQPVQTTRMATTGAQQKMVVAPRENFRMASTQATQASVVPMTNVAVPANEYGFVGSYRLNERVSPNGKIVAVAHHGDRFQIVGHSVNHRWTEIISHGEKRWVASRYLKAEHTLK